MDDLQTLKVDQGRPSFVSAGMIVTVCSSRAVSAFQFSD